MTFNLPGNQPLSVFNNLSYCGRKPNVWKLGISWCAWRTLFACYVGPESILNAAFKGVVHLKKTKKLVLII